MSRRVLPRTLAPALVVLSATPTISMADISAAVVTQFTTEYAASAESTLARCNSTLDEAKKEQLNPKDLYPDERASKFQEAYDCFNQALVKLQDSSTRLVTDTVRPNFFPDEVKSLAPGVQSKLSSDQQQANNGKTAAAQGQSKAQNQVNFMGWNFGLGLGYLWGTGPKRVTASLVNNVVRVSSDVTDGPRVVGESHYFFPNKKGTYGLGPFAAIETGSSNSTNSTGLTGFGVGGMVGWQVDAKSSSAFNIGVGYMWEPNVQTLGDGISANQPLPTGETQIRYKNRSAGGAVLFFSWKFGSTAPTQSSSTPSS